MTTFVAAAMPDESPSTDICLHPLVIMNIADHATRASLINATQQQQSPSSTAPAVLGILFGTVSNRRIEILTSFEAVMTSSAEGGGPAWDLLRGKKERLSTVFPTYDVVGWYKTGDSLAADELAFLHATVRDVFAVDSPLVLVMNTKPSQSEYTLPVYVFEVSLSSPPSARRVTYSVESEETERIGVEMAMNVVADRSSGSGTSSSGSDLVPPLVPQAERLRQALRMLHMQVSLVLQYLLDLKEGKVPRDSAMLRSIASLCNQLPCGGTPSFNHAAAVEYEDTLLTVYLGLLTKQQRQLEVIAAKNASTKVGSIARRMRQW